MKIKNLVLLGAIAISSLAGIITIINPADSYATFDPENGCPKSSLYFSQKAKFANNKPTNVAECNVIPDAENEDVMSRANVIINVIVGVVGIVAVAVIVLGGVTFVTSQGDTAKTAKAKNTIIYGVVGLLVALLAFAIVNFVLKSVF